MRLHPVHNTARLMKRNRSNKTWKKGKVSIGTELFYRPRHYNLMSLSLCDFSLQNMKASLDSPKLVLQKRTHSVTELGFNSQLSLCIL